MRRRLSAVTAMSKLVLVLQAQKRMTTRGVALTILHIAFQNLNWSDSSYYPSLDESGRKNYKSKLRSNNTTFPDPHVLKQDTWRAD